MAKMTKSDIAGTVAVSALIGALSTGVGGTISKFGLSLFNPSLASTAGTFGTFAGLGAIAAPLAVIPYLLKQHFFDEKSVLKDHPILKKELSSTFNLINIATSTVTAALILGIPPFGTTVIVALAIPVISHALDSIFTLVSALLNNDDNSFQHIFSAN